MNQEDSIFFPLKKPFVFSKSVLLFKSKKYAIFWKRKLYLNNCIQTYTINSPLKWFQFDDIVVINVPLCPVSFKLKRYMKLESDVELLTNHSSKISKFLYDEIQLDELGLCNIVADFIQI
jgi:hypothetical protein